LGRIALVSGRLFSRLALYGFGIAADRQSVRRPTACDPAEPAVGSVVGFAFAVGSPLIGSLIDRY
jgi:hypothetical protein